MTANPVLIIDSDTTTAEALQDLFESHELPTEVATDGQIGLQKAQELHPRLIVLAIELPLISGYSVCKKIKRNSGLNTIPLFLISSTATEDTFAQHRKLKTHADEYFLKPLSYDDLWAEAESRLYPERAAANLPDPDPIDEEEVIALGDSSSLAEASYVPGGSDEDNNTNEGHDTANQPLVTPPPASNADAPVELVILRRQVESREADLQAIREEHNRALSELMELRSNHTTAQNQILELKQEMNRRDSELGDSRRRITDLEIADEQLRTSLTQANTRADDLSTKLDALRQNQQAELEQLNEDQDQLEDRYTEQLAELQQLRRHGSELETQLAEKTEAFEALETQLAEKTQAHQESEETYKNLEEAHANQIEEMGELQTRITALEGENEAAHSILGEAEEQLDILQKERDGFKTQFEEKTAELAALQRDYEAASEARGEVQSQVQTLQEERDAIHEEREALRLEIDGLQEKIDALNQSQESLGGNLSGAQDKIATLEAELQTAAAVQESLGENNEDLKGALDDLRSVSNQRQSELETINTSLNDELQNALTDLEATAQYASELELKLQSAGELIQKLAGLMAASQQALGDARRVTSLTALSTTAATGSIRDGSLFPPSLAENSFDDPDDEDSIDIDIDAYEQPSTSAPPAPMTRPRDPNTEQLANELMEELTNSFAEELEEPDPATTTQDLSLEALEGLQNASRESTAIHARPEAPVSHTEMFSGNSGMEDVSQISVVDIEDDPLISGDGELLDDAVVVDEIFVDDEMEVGDGEGIVVDEIVFDEDEGEGEGAEKTNSPA